MLHGGDRMQTILVDSIPEETRIAVIEDEHVTDFFVERPMHSHLVGNIYLGRVQNVLPGMQAAFVDIGWKKNAFVYIGADKGGVNPSIHKGQQVLIQVSKEATDMKGPRATFHLTIPGHMMVLMPQSAYIGMSHRIDDEDERSRLHDIAEKLCPDGMGLIVRTAAEGQSEEAISDDINYIVHIWNGIKKRAAIEKAPAMLYRNVDLAIRIVRDVFTRNTDELIVNDTEIARRSKDLISSFAPPLAERVSYYDGADLFHEYGADEISEHIADRIITLPSGSFLVIDRTEALTVIDINSGKYVGSTNLADTAFQVNIECADEVMRQIRLRDIGGIIIVDFIDMAKPSQRLELLDRLREIARHDRTRTNVVDITALGLVEITRRKTRESTDSMLYTDCPFCHGRGRTESPETTAVKLLRRLRSLEAEAHAPMGYLVKVSTEVYNELIDSSFFKSFKNEFTAQIEVAPDESMASERYVIIQKNG